jgi:hypothetical protein
VDEPVVVDEDVVEVWALAVDNAGYASSTAMMPIVAAITVAVFANLVVIFKGRAPLRIFTEIPKSFHNC